MLNSLRWNWIIRNLWLTQEDSHIHQIIKIINNILPITIQVINKTINQIITITIIIIGINIQISILISILISIPINTLIIININNIRVTTIIDITQHHHPYLTYNNYNKCMIRRNLMKLSKFLEIFFILKLHLLSVHKE